MSVNSFDYVIVGAGIMGLAIARELKIRDSTSKILILEKEKQIGMHASGRNSGVLHSGIYYSQDSLKATLCAQGAERMARYCEEFRLPIQKIGKVIVPVNQEQDTLIDMLYEQASANGAQVSIIDAKALHELEPDVCNSAKRALYSPNTSIIDSQAVLNHLMNSLKKEGVCFEYNAPFENADLKMSYIKSRGIKYSYGHFYNAAGLYADKVAHNFGVGSEYTILPFKGTYLLLSPDSNIRCNGLIYPVPDLQYPFLGIHFTKMIDGDVYVGPSAVPALSRENYQGLQNLKVSEATSVIATITQLYFRNKQGFRRFSHKEARCFFKKQFVKTAQWLVPKLQAEQLSDMCKVGIRAQLLNSRSMELVMDFVIERKDNTTHILNAVSPAFTSAFSFADLLASEQI